MNLSFEMEPNVLKNGKIVSILKKQNSHLLENYKPVTVPFGF